MKTYHTINGPKLPLNTSQFPEIIAEVESVIGEPGEIETLEHWEGPDTGIDIIVTDGKAEIRIATGWHAADNGDIVRG